MMNLSKEQSKALEEMAYLLIPTNLIAINLDIDEIDFKLEIRDPKSPVYKAFYKGIIRQKMELHQSIVQASKNGSNPAQEQIIKMLEVITGQLRYG